jgi:predicted nucleic acid-binding protein
LILADTSIWMDYLRGDQPRMQQFLSSGQIVMHPFVCAEIALGSLSDRKKIFELLDSLWEVNVARLEEVRSMIEVHALYSRGLGLTDVHLLASCVLTTGTMLWTRDNALDKAAQVLRINAGFA